MPGTAVPRCLGQTGCDYVPLANEQPNLTHKRIQRAGTKDEGSVGPVTSDHKKNRLVSSGNRVAHFEDLITAIIVEYLQSSGKLHKQTIGAALQIIF